MASASSPTPRACSPPPPSATVRTPSCSTPSPGSWANRLLAGGGVPSHLLDTDGPGRAEARRGLHLGGERRVGRGLEEARLTQPRHLEHLRRLGGAGPVALAEVEIDRDPVAPSRSGSRGG